MGVERIEFEPIWFEVLAEKYPWFKELLKETKFEDINKKLGDYETAYKMVVRGPRGYNSGYFYKKWWDTQEKGGKLEYWFNLFGEGEKLKRILEREAAEARESDETRCRIVAHIEGKRAAEREAYDRIVRG